MTEADDHIFAFGVTKKEFVGAFFSLVGGVSIKEDQQSALQRPFAYGFKAHQSMS